MNYVLVTAARNEETIIRSALESVVAQTRLPRTMGDRRRRIDRSDGSDRRRVRDSDTRGSIWCAAPPRANRSFAGKVHAINAALERLRCAGRPLRASWATSTPMSLSSRDYMAFLLDRFADDRPARRRRHALHCRTAATIRHETASRATTTSRDRVSCFAPRASATSAATSPNPAGGVDWIAVMTAR